MISTTHHPSFFSTITTLVLVIVFLSTLATSAAHAGSTRTITKHHRLNPSALSTITEEVDFPDEQPSLKRTVTKRLPASTAAPRTVTKRLPNPGAVSETLDIDEGDHQQPSKRTVTKRLPAGPTHRTVTRRLPNHFSETEELDPTEKPQLKRTITKRLPMSPNPGAVSETLDIDEGDHQQPLKRTVTKRLPAGPTHRTVTRRLPNPGHHVSETEELEAPSQQPDVQVTASRSVPAAERVSPPGPTDQQNVGVDGQGTIAEAPSGVHRDRGKAASSPLNEKVIGNITGLHLVFVCCGVAVCGVVTVFIVRYLRTQTPIRRSASTCPAEQHAGVGQDEAMHFPTPGLVVVAIQPCKEAPPTPPATTKPKGCSPTLPNKKEEDDLSIIL